MSNEAIEKVRAILREFFPVQWRRCEDFIVVCGCGREYINSKRSALIEEGFDVSSMWRETSNEQGSIVSYQFTVAEKTV